MTDQNAHPEIPTDLESLAAQDFKFRSATDRETKVTKIILYIVAIVAVCYATADQIEWFVAPPISDREFVTSVNRTLAYNDGNAPLLCWQLSGRRLRPTKLTAVYAVLSKDGDSQGVWRTLVRPDGESIVQRGYTSIGHYAVDQCVELPPEYTKAINLHVQVTREYEGYGRWELDAPKIIINYDNRQP